MSKKYLSFFFVPKFNRKRPCNTLLSFFLWADEQGTGQHQAFPMALRPKSYSWHGGEVHELEPQRKAEPGESERKPAAHGGCRRRWGRYLQSLARALGRWDADSEIVYKQFKIPFLAKAGRFPVFQNLLQIVNRVIIIYLLFFCPDSIYFNCWNVYCRWLCLRRRMSECVWELF